MALSTTAPAVSDAHPGASRWYARALPSALVLTLVLVALLLMTDPMGFLSTDVGGKLATLEAMHRNGGLSPDLGYWAEAVDPDGSLYPMFKTALVEGNWVNVTTLPMLLVALPLYSVGGAVGAGLVPVAGTVVAALGARSLARRLGGDGTMAFWIVGAASPATVYALDFWEHSWGLALMIWAMAWTLDAARAERGFVPALLAGLAFGAAATMRQEALVYGFVAGITLGVRVLWRGRPVDAVLRGAAMVAGLATTTVVNGVLESTLVGDATRTDRSASAAAKVGGHLSVRIEEAILTAASPFARTDPIYLLLALVTAAALVELGRRAFAADADLLPVLAVLGAVGAAVVIDLIGSGLAFVPGLVATTPVAALAVSRTWDEPDRRHVGVVALASLPLVWAVQYTGGAAPQWGGRYILLTGALLVVVATTVFTDGRPRQVLRGAALAGLAMTLVGVAWTVERTHAFADAMQALADRDEPALVFHDPHLAREGGVLVLDEHWLVATGEDARREAADALAELGISRIGFVQHDRGDDPIVLPGWSVVADERVPLVSGLSLRVTTQTAPG